MLPFKVAILDYAIDHVGETLSADSIMEGMKDTPYAKESQFRKQNVETYCDAFAQCGFFIKENVIILPDGNLDVSYQITDYAIKRGNRFIPHRKAAKK